MFIIVYKHKRHKKTETRKGYDLDSYTIEIYYTVNGKSVCY